MVIGRSRKSFRIAGVYTSKYRVLSTMKLAEQQAGLDFD
jgi:hypothetical protein